MKSKTRLRMWTTISTSRKTTLRDVPQSYSATKGETCEQPWTHLSLIHIKGEGKASPENPLRRVAHHLYHKTRYKPLHITVCDSHS